MPDAPTERVNLIMGGGGVRLPAYVGGLAALADLGVAVQRVAGASAGSIVASYLAAGWPLERMRKLVLDTNFSDFKDLSLRGILLEGGLYAGNRFEAWMDRHLEGARFRDLPGQLYVTAVDLIAHESYFFSREATPDLRVSRAVRCSMAIPWVWRPQRLEQKLLVDGQLLPWIGPGLELLTREPQATSAPRTIMFRLVADVTRPRRTRRHLWPWDFAKILLETMFSALENQRVPGPQWQDTILINVGAVPTLQFDLSLAEKNRLFECGYDQVRRYFHKDRAGATATPPSPGDNRPRPS